MDAAPELDRVVEECFGFGKDLGRLHLSAPLA